MSNMNDIRRGIDAVDYELLKLLNERMELVLRLKKLKKEIVDPERELEVFNHIRSWSKNLIDAGFSERLFREIVAESRRLQERRLTVIGFQGEHGAYSEAAAIAFDPESVPLPCRDFVDVFDGLRNDQLDLGIVPVENSLEGAVTQVNDLLIEGGLSIVGEIVIPIRHHLLAARGTDYRDIRVVYSHPQALAQCHGFVTRNNLEPRPFYDTAGAAKMIARGETTSAAAIASGLCAELYNLEIIKENIEDHAGNATRFVVLSREPSATPGDPPPPASPTACGGGEWRTDGPSVAIRQPHGEGGQIFGYGGENSKCSVAFRTRDEAGALFRIMKIFADNGVNLTRIESRPVKGSPGEYAFLLDFQGSATNDRVRRILDALPGMTLTHRFLGCYREFRR